MKIGMSTTKWLLFFGGGLLSMMACSVAMASTVIYVYTDPQGTTLAEADQGGNVTAQFDYRPYGSVYTGGGMASTVDGPGFTGHVGDPDTAFIYMQARYYDPATGRFMSVDPKTPTAGDAFDFNRFAYVDDNPIHNADPDGTTCTEVVKGQYNCQIDGNKGNLSGAQVRSLNKAYTSAVNRLNSHPDAKATISVKGASFTARAGDVARGLINARMDTQPASNSERAETWGGGLFASSKYGLDYTPQVNIHQNALTMDRNGGRDPASIEEDLERTITHEGIHTLIGDRAMQQVYKANQKHWGDIHRDTYNRAGDKLLDGGK